MGKSQLLAVALGIILVGGLYFFGNTTPALKNGAQAPSGQASHQHSVSWDSLYKQAYQGLPVHARTEIEALSVQLQGKDSLAMIPIFNQLSDAWLSHKKPVPAAYYKSLSAKLENSEKSLTFAGQFLLDVANLESLSEESRHWAYEEAVEVLGKAVQINPLNDTTQLAYGVALIEGLGQTMDGIQQLLAVTKRNPNHIAANLILGRMSIQSGQWEKAVQRLETVNRLQPQNREALFFLAEAYKGNGQKEKGIETLNRLKTMVSDPEFSSDIDNYIKSF